MSHFKLKMRTDNAAFVDGDGRRDEIVRILRHVADNVERDTQSVKGALMDSNGNNVGQWSWSEKGDDHE